VTPGPGQAQRTVEVLAEHDLAARRVDGIDAVGRLEPDVVHVTCGRLSSGLVCEPVRWSC
jgi:hypothetical protein